MASFFFPSLFHASQTGVTVGRVKTTRWGTKTAIPLFANALRKHGEIVLVGSSKGTLIAFNAHTRMQLWDKTGHTGT